MNFPIFFNDFVGVMFFQASFLLLLPYRHPSWPSRRFSDVRNRYSTFCEATVLCTNISETLVEGWGLWFIQKRDRRKHPTPGLTNFNPHNSLRTRLRAAMCIHIGLLKQREWM